MEIKGSIGELIGEGNRSQVFSSTHENCVVKMTDCLKEKETLENLYEESQSWAVKVYGLEYEGDTLFALVEKLPVVDFSFRLKNGEWFTEANKGFFAALKVAEATSTEDEELEVIECYISARVAEINATETEVRDFYSVLLEAYRNGFDPSEVAWNMGKRADGSFCCYDPCLR